MTRADWIARLIAAAPPLSAKQRVVIAAAFSAAPRPEQSNAPDEAA